MSTNEMPLIQVKDLKKSFGDTVVLDGVSIDIHKGERVVVIGPSGSGKSTFLRCLNLLETPTDGVITFDNTELTAPKVNINLQVRLMFLLLQSF